jgi:hypothetical protein
MGVAETDGGLPAVGLYATRVTSAPSAAILLCRGRRVKGALTGVATR